MTKKLSIQILLERFEKDIIYDVHSTRTKTNRSAARKKIILIGIGVLVEVCKFAEISLEKCNSSEMHLVWSQLIHELVRNQYGEVDYPEEKYMTGPVWISWACENYLMST